MACWSSALLAAPYWCSMLTPTWSSIQSNSVHLMHHSAVLDWRFKTHRVFWILLAYNVELHRPCQALSSSCHLTFDIDLKHSLDFVSVQGEFIRTQLWFNQNIRSSIQQWATMDNSGQQLTTMETMDNNGQQWTKMDNNGQQWTSMNNNGQQWITMDHNLLTKQL